MAVKKKNKMKKKKKKIKDKTKTERSADYVRQTLKRREIQIMNINFSQNTRLKCMKHDYQQTVLERGDVRSTGKGRG